MKSLQITGGNKISGSIQLGGNKNAALPMLIASLLTDEELILHSMPKILDVLNMLQIAEHIGISVRWEGDTLILKGGSLKNWELPPALCRKVRTSLMFAGPLTARLGKASLVQPGGDGIGRRRTDGHFYGLKKLGIDCTISEAVNYTFNLTGKLTGAEIFLDEASVTATEHILLTAVLAKGTTTLINAACEPHVTQLGRLLNAMGAKISGLESNILTIQGVPRLHGAEMTVEADHIEAASFLSLCAVTGGEIEMTGALQPHTYWMTRRIFERFSLNFTVRPGSLTMRCPRTPKVVNEIGNAMPVIADGTWPQFASDMMSCMVVVATQARGSVLFFEKMFESRLYFVDKLITMGANAVICDPHRVVVTGPAKLHGIEMSSPDIRAGMAMVLAASCAEGTSLVRNAEMIYRGYGNLIPKLRTLGINVTELES